MSMSTWQETLFWATGDGPTITAIGAASCVQPSAKGSLYAGFFYVGRMIKITMQGRISCVVTTPGTARFDVRLGGAIVFDGGALNLNIVAKVTVPFWSEIILSCRAVGSGTTANLMGLGSFTSEAVVGSALPSAGGNGSLLMPVGTPAVGAGFDSTAAQQVDVFFTQTVSTGSITVHQYKVEALN